MDYGSGINYGDLLLQAEIEHCEYYFNVADVDALKAVYDTYENEARRCLEAHLVMPAHDFNLKCSFLFNVMDTRGAIGVTERAHYFGRMRRIARQIAEAYVEQRQRLEYPFLDDEVPVSKKVHQPEPAAEARGAAPQTFVLEIGSEELPDGDLSSAVKQLRASVPQLLEDLRLSYNRVEVRGTPRRLAVIVHQLEPRQSDLEMEAKGPPADRAFDADGNPTKAALGFARSKGIDPAELKIVSEGERRYVAALVREEGQPAVTVLAEALPDLVAGIRFDKSMRWNESNIAYSRPLRWLVALYGSQIVPFSYAGVQSGRTSRGLRPLGSPEIEIDRAGNYTGLMAENNIVLQTRERKNIISMAAGNQAQEVGGVIREDERLLTEVANLVEQPTVLRGEFERRFLTLPPQALVAVMKKHQRYFPMYAQDGKRLLPYFITVRNGDEAHLDIVRDGNEHVIRARFSDADFFYKQDTKHQLAEFLPRLDTLTFQAELGSMLDKVQRLEKLTPVIAGMLGLDEEETAAATRAAALSKADLATSLVVEMTALQGVMGGHYAELGGESEAVVAAISEQYEPVSETRPGLALALSDRLDSLMGLFAAGLAPKGSNDPFALRRAAIQIIENLITNEVSFDLRAALQAAAALLPVEAGPGAVDAVMGFVNGRLENYLQEAAYRTHVIRAVLGELAHNPYAASEGVKALSEAIKEPDWPQLLDSYARCVRISRDHERYPFQADAYSLSEEKAIVKTLQGLPMDGTVGALVASLRLLEPDITRFFDSILVMDEDTAVRQNRLALLQQIAGLAAGIADLSQLEGF
jgi:glycyl-tRNA synthetase